MNINDFALEQHDNGNKYIYEKDRIKKDLIYKGVIDGDLIIDGKVNDNFVLEGLINGDLVINGTIGVCLALKANVSGNLIIKGTVKLVIFMGVIDGDLKVEGTIEEDLMASGEIAKSIFIGRAGVIGRELEVKKKLGKAQSLIVHGEIKESVSIKGIVDRIVLRETGSIGGNLSVTGSIGGLTTDSIIEGVLMIKGSVENGIIFAGRSIVKGGLHIEGDIGGDLLNTGQIHNVAMVRDTGSIGGNFHAYGGSIEMLALHGSIEGNLHLDGNFFGKVFLAGSVNGSVSLLGSFDKECIFTNRISVSTLKCHFDRPVNFNDFVDLSNCDFTGFTSLDACKFSGSNLFGKGPKSKQRRRFLTHERERAQRQRIKTMFAEELDLSEQVNIYRQLRRVYENSGNRPGASDFYFREMEARKKMLKGKGGKRVERITLSIYKHISSFGLNPFRAAAYFISFLILGTIGFKIGGVDLIEIEVDDTEKTITGSKINPIPGNPFKTDGLVDLATFTLKSMISFLDPPDARLSDWETWIQISLRFTGPILLTQVILATREKVAR